MSVKSPKKLIEVALPLDDINVAAAKEKSIRHGHPSTLHLWWARRPLAAARAVIFAQMVNDPGGERGYYAGKTKQQANQERERLFGIMRRLVLWENTNNAAVLAEARAEIVKSWRETCELNKGKPGFDPDRLPAFHDPFAGGGAIPLEAQRLGLESYASDLNPVAVLINKAMIELPPRFAGRAPVGPVPASDRQGRLVEDWSGAKGLAEDVRRYAAWIRQEAEKRIGFLYPKARLPNGGEDATVVAWLWVRTVRSPNPAFSHIEVPLTSTFVVSSKKGREIFVEPVVKEDGYDFRVVSGSPTPEALRGTKASRGSFLCIMSGAPITYKYVDEEAANDRMGVRLMAIVAEGPRGRIYLPPCKELEEIVSQAYPEWKPETPCRGTFGSNAQGRLYGFKVFGDYFTNRQLVALNTFAGLIQEGGKKARQAAIDAGWTDDGKALACGGAQATAYGEAVATYLAFALTKMADRGSSLCTWFTDRDSTRNTFSRQSLAMTWDFAELNTLLSGTGSFLGAATWTAESIEGLGNSASSAIGVGIQTDAATQTLSAGKVVSTDPPYYDNISYADLSDYFYVWLRRVLRPIFPDLFSTMAVPKAEELVATPYRHGGREAAEEFFLNGMTQAMRRLAENSHSGFPTTIYYAFKQSATDGDGTASTGWETFLEAVIRAGFSITGTWPIRTELANRMVGSGANALASSIVLVCRKREVDTSTISRKEFLRELRDALPAALDDMLNGGEGRAPIAPVDLSQAIMGPGMAVFSKYSAVLEADGTPMSVHTAMKLINRFLDEGEDFDADTRFCVAWFQQYGWATSQFGTADVLARSKGTSVDHVANAGVAETGGGKVRLLKTSEYPAGWDPRTDTNMPVWESLHHLIKALSERGEDGAGALLARMHDMAEPIRALAYRLYTLCERKGWAEDARAYNTIITSWADIDAASHRVGRVGTQATLDV